MAEARDLRARWYNGEKTERIPFVYSLAEQQLKPSQSMRSADNPHTFREMCEDGRKAVDWQIACMQRQFDGFPDCDYLPAMNLYYLGEGILAAIYGAEQFLVDEYPPFTKGRIYPTIEATMAISNEIEIEDTVWGRILKEHVEMFVDASGGEIPVSMPDYQSPYGTATKLAPNEELMLAMYDAPELVHQFLSTITDGIIRLISALERWVGKDLVAHNLSNPIPGKSGIILWDDYISVLNPELHKEFCAPYNIKLFERYGYGHLHTCGPYFPAFIDACLACSPRSMDVSIMRNMGKTKADMLEFLAITSKRNIRLFGSLDTNDESIFSEGGCPPDRELIETFVRGGFFPGGAGTREEGEDFRKFIASIKLD